MVAPKKANTQTTEKNALQKRRGLMGVVVSNRMQKTIVVRVDRRVKHRFYKKYVLRSQKYKAHDETNEAKMGDQVRIIESRPLSKEKRWVLQKIVRKANIVAEAAI